MTTYPDYVEKVRTKGTQVMVRGDNYYLYKISSKWDKEKGRSQKTTDEYLGKITPEGVIPPKHKRAVSKIDSATIKEFGASVLINHLSQRLQIQLKRTYAEDWKSIFTMATLRFFHKSPIKNLSHHFKHSHLSEVFSGAKMTPKNVSTMLEKVGSDRERMVLFMKELVNSSSENLLVDMTHIFSSSENINWLSIGRNSEDQFHKQLNMLLIFSNDRMKPVYFRLLPGSIRDVSSIKATVAESNISNAVFVGDKGFHSEGNVKTLERNQIQYILPIKRNNSDTNYEIMEKPNREGFDGFFFFEKRYIWFKEWKSKKPEEGRRVIMFFDEKLRVDEENSFLERISKIPKEKKEEKEQMMKSFYEKQFAMGTITIVTNTDHEAEKIYHYLKTRTNVEVAFDVFKNILEADKTYMRTDAQIYGWLFVNFISLLLYYNLYGILTSKKLIQKYSPKDVILHFSKVYKVQVQDNEVVSEVPKTTRILAEKMELPDDLLCKT